MSTAFKKEILSNRVIYLLGLLVVVVTPLIGILINPLVSILSVTILLCINVSSVLRYTDEDFAYFITLPVKKRDFINLKYILNILTTTICIVIIFFTIKFMKVEGEIIIFFVSIVVLIMAIYSFAIPLIIKGGRDSIGLNLLLLLPILTGPIINTVEKYFENYFTSDINSLVTASVIIFVMALIIYILSYILSIKIVDNKNF